MSSFATFLIGILILILGLSVGAYMLNAPPMWIAIGALVMLGMGVMTATMRTKPRDPPTS